MIFDLNRRRTVTIYWNSSGMCSITEEKHYTVELTSEQFEERNIE